VKYYYVLNYILFSSFIYFKMQFIPVMEKLKFQHPVSVSYDPYAVLGAFNYFLYFCNIINVLNNDTIEYNSYWTKVYILLKKSLTPNF